MKDLLVFNLGHITRQSYTQGKVWQHFIELSQKATPLYFLILMIVKLYIYIPQLMQDY